MSQNRTRGGGRGGGGGNRGGNMNRSQQGRSTPPTTESPGNPSSQNAPKPQQGKGAQNKGNPKTPRGPPENPAAPLEEKSSQNEVPVIVPDLPLSSESPAQVVIESPAKPGVDSTGESQISESPKPVITPETSPRQQPQTKKQPAQQPQKKGPPPKNPPAKKEGGPPQKNEPVNPAETAEPQPSTETPEKTDTVQPAQKKEPPQKKAPQQQQKKDAVPQQKKETNPQQKKDAAPPPKKDPPPKKEAPPKKEQPAKGQPAKGKNSPAAAGKPAAQQVDTPEDNEEESAILNTATSGVFQFGTPVHGFTPMSFNFSLPTTDIQPTEPELPSHSGPCVVTTGGVTYSLEQKPTVTLEESEEVIFVSRAKLYRFDPVSNEWKERGTGDFKILKHSDSGKYRILMRRDKILKICANHYISPTYELSPHSSFPETCWTYITDSDFSDEVVKQSTLAVRFKDSQLAQRFKVLYDNARDEMKRLLPEDAVVPPKTKENSNQLKPTGEKTIESVHKEISDIQLSLGNVNRPHPPPELSLEFLYDEVLHIKETLKNMQEEFNQLKNFVQQQNKKK